MAARKPSGRVAASKAPTDAEIAALARSYAALKQKLADTEATLAREKQERSADADTIAEMLLRIVGLEKALKATASSDVRSRSLGPPAAHTGAMQRVASLESRVDDAVMRARAAETRTATAEARARAADDRIAEVVRDQEMLRTSLADADARARTAEDRVAHAEQLAKAARARAVELNDRFEMMQTEIVSLEARARAAENRARDLKQEELPRDDRELELVRIQLEAAHIARDDARAAIAQEKDAHQRELEQQRDRHAMALRAAHDAYAEAFNDTLEDERQRVRDELEEERARTRDAHARIAELEDLLKSADDRMAAAVTRVQSELEAMTFDRDAADRQSELTMMQLQAAEAKLQLVDKQLARAEDLARGNAELLELIRSARGALG
jgi:chromosome segregation ATPase